MLNNVLYLNDGTREVLYGDDSFQRFIYEKLGTDAEQEIIKLKNEADIVERKLDMDFRAYEATAEEARDTVYEISTIAESLLTLLEAPRMNREKIRNLVSDIHAICIDY